jgi:hypothetical protein
MASNIYSRKTVDGKTTFYSRKGTQGRKAIPPELRKVKLSARVTRQTSERIKQEAKKHNLTSSAYCDLALSLFDISVFVGHKSLNNS